VGLILGIGGSTLVLGDFSLGAIGVGSFGALAIYHGMRAIAVRRGTDPALLHPESAVQNGSAAPFER
jgi:hypothetical protein